MASNCGILVEFHELCTFYLVEGIVGLREGFFGFERFAYAVFDKKFLQILFTNWLLAVIIHP